MARDSTSSSSARTCCRGRVCSFGRPLTRLAVVVAALGLAFLADGPVMDAVQPLSASSIAELLRHTVRWLGTGYVQVAALLLLIAVGAIGRLPALRAGAWALLAFVVSGAAATAIKVLVHRPRPWTEGAAGAWPDYLHDSDFHSFPSGETTTTFAVALVLGSWYPSWRWPLLAISGAVGVARVLVGSHHPSDVVAGVVLAAVVARYLMHVQSKRQDEGSVARTEEALP